MDTTKRLFLSKYSYKMYTISNADSGSSTGTQTVKIDLTNYALKKDTATKEEFEALVNTVAGKLDKVN